MIYKTLDEALDLVSDQKNVILTFSADWCAPCRALTPVLEEIQREGVAKVAKVNVDVEDKERLSQYGIRSIPTSIMFRDGEIVNRAIGIQTKTKLLQMLS